MVTWIIQSSGLYLPEQHDTADALVEAGVQWCDVGIYPFVDEMSHLDVENPVIFLGSTKLIRIAMEQKDKWNPGIFFDYDKFNLQSWVTHRREDMLNIPMVSTMGDLFDYWMNSIWEYKFFRPLHDLKAFSGECLHRNDFVQWYDYNKAFVDDEIKVAICEPINLEREWRYFIVDHKIVSGSQYFKNGKLSVTSEISTEAFQQAEQFAKGWLPAEVVVMDVGRLKSGRYGIIEFNCFNASGFYDNDKVTIIKAVDDYVNSSLNITGDVQPS